MRHLIRFVQVALIAALSSASVAKDSSPPEPDSQSVRLGPASWSQAQREFWFAHMEKIHPARVIAHGKQVHSLPEGAALPTFSPKGEGTRRLQQSIEDAKLAGIVVLQDGRLRLEQYALGHSAAGRWASMSIAKSLTSTLVGIAIKDGDISDVDDLVTRYIPELRDSAYDGVTVRQLLTMTSGIRWNENYTDQKSDVRQFRTAPIDPGMDATVSYMKKLPRVAVPGQKWHYSTGGSDLLAVVVARATGKDLATYASEKIWTAYGMERDAAWVMNATGLEFGGCCIQAATRDFARLGQFILDGARIDGRSIVADGWLEAATRKQVDTGSRSGFGYGYQWWTRDDGTFKALGVFGQQIHIDRARRLVVAINSARPAPSSTKEEIAATMGLLGAINAAIDSERGSSPAK